jgi:hypothetical protein
MQQTPWPAVHAHRIPPVHPRTALQQPSVLACVHTRCRSSATYLVGIQIHRPKVRDECSLSKVLEMAVLGEQRLQMLAHCQRAIGVDFDWCQWDFALVAYERVHVLAVWCGCKAQHGSAALAVLSIPARELESWLPPKAVVSTTTFQWLDIALFARHDGYTNRHRQGSRLGLPNPLLGNPNHEMLYRLQTAPLCSRQSSQSVSQSVRIELARVVSHLPCSRSQNVLYVANRAICAILPCNCMTDTPGRKRRNASYTKRTCLQLAKKMMHLVFK